MRSVYHIMELTESNFKLYRFLSRTKEKSINIIISNNLYFIKDKFKESEYKWNK